MIPPKIRERLTLDHFYIPATLEEISHLAAVVPLFRGAVHERTISGDEHWEGIYIPCRTGVYFEIVHYSKSSDLGLAFSPSRPQYTDARKITEEFPELQWQKGARLTKEHQPWFDWLSLGDPSLPTPPILDAWVMHYHFSHWDQFRSADGPRTVDRFKAIHLTLGRQRVQEVRALVPWLPGTQTWGDERVEFSLPLRDGNRFIVYIDIVDGESPFRFERLEVEITRGQLVEPSRIGLFSLEMIDSHTLAIGKN